MAIIPYATIVSYVFSSNLIGLAISHTAERFGRYSFSRKSALDWIAIYLLLAAGTWYGKMVRDYYVAFNVKAVLFSESLAAEHMQNMLPVLAMATTQTVFAGIFAQTAQGIWIKKIIIASVIAHTLALSSCLAQPMLSLSAWKGLTIGATLLILAGTILTAVHSLRFANRIRSNLTTLKGRNLNKNKMLFHTVRKCGFAAFLGIAYSILNIIAIAIQSRSLIVETGYIFVDQNSMVFVAMVCKDIYVWFAGWSCFALLQLKIQTQEAQAQSVPKSVKKVTQRTEIASNKKLLDSSKDVALIRESADMIGPQLSSSFKERMNSHTGQEETGTKTENASAASVTDNISQIPPTKLLDDNVNLQPSNHVVEMKGRLQYRSTTGLRLFADQCKRPFYSWLTYSSSVSNVVHRTNHYTLTAVLIITIYLGFNDKSFRGDLFDPIMISQLFLVFLLPPVFSPIYWISEWIMIPIVMRPYHRFLLFLQEKCGQSFLLDLLLSVSVFSKDFDRDEMGIRITYLLVLLWGAPFWICNRYLIIAGPGTASFGFTAVGISGVGISLLDTCLGCRISILLNRLKIIPSDKVACARTVYEITD